MSKAYGSYKGSEISAWGIKMIRFDNKDKGFCDAMVSSKDYTDLRNYNFFNLTTENESVANHIRKIHTLRLKNKNDKIDLSEVNFKGRLSDPSFSYLCIHRT